MKSYDKAKVSIEVRASELVQNVQAVQTVQNVWNDMNYLNGWNSHKHRPIGSLRRARASIAVQARIVRASNCGRAVVLGDFLVCLVNRDINRGIHT